MKRLVLLAMLGLASTIALPAKAQVNVNINIGSQPDWGPRGYNHVDYYYLPEVESYYYVPTKKFVYYKGKRWVHASSLPSRYRGYNLYSGPKYVINSPRPYMQHHVYKVKYEQQHRSYNSRPDHHRKDYRKKERHNKGNQRHYQKRGEKRDAGIERIIRPHG